MPARQEWSVRADGGKTDWSGPQVVVFVPDDGDLSRGFEWLRQELNGGESVVRLIGCGVTDPSSWPTWLSTHPRASSAILTEVDAYLPLDRGARLESFALDVDGWLRRVFAGDFGTLDVARAFRSTFTNRVLLQQFSAWTLLEGLSTHHPTDPIRSPDARWQAWLKPQMKPTLLERSWFALRLLAAASVLVVASLGRRAWEFVKEAPSRKKLVDLAGGLRGAPKVWVGVIGSWPYASRHVLESVKSYEAEFGVLLQDTLKPGALDAHLAGKVEAKDAVLPTLGQPALAGRYGAIGQVVSAMTGTELVASSLRGVWATARATLRAALVGPRIGIFTIEDRIQGIARVLTIDVLRAHEAEAATAKLIASHDFSGSRILWPHASAPSVTVPDLMLQAAGATTIELVHGAFADRQGVVTYAFSASSIRATWTEVEARFLEPHMRGQRCVGGFVPRAAAVERLPRPKVSRILALTNYGAGVLGPTVARFSRLGYCQQAFFEALDAAVAASGREFEVVWRPHPADDERSFAAILKRYSYLTLSRGQRSLEADLEATDLVVSSWSSALVEALRHPVPVFVHTIPYYEATGVFAAFDATRTFTTGQSLIAGFNSCLLAVERNLPGSLAAEQTLRTRFFGTSRSSRSAEMALQVSRASA